MFNLKVCLDVFVCLLVFIYQVAENRCWSCGLTCKSNKDLQCHLHEAVNLEEIKLLWDDDKYLKPFIEDDSLLYSFAIDEEGEDDFATSVYKEEVMKDLANIEKICLEDDNAGQNSEASSNNFGRNETKEVAPLLKGPLNLVAKDIKKVNDNYFGAYSSFGIHREMISDKVLSLLIVISHARIWIKWGMCELILDSLAVLLRPLLSGYAGKNGCL